MSKLLIPDLDDTTETEAKVILSDVLGSEDAWAGANAIFDQLSASGRSFSDSADLIREDRER